MVQIKQEYIIYVKWSKLCCFQDVGNIFVQMQFKSAHLLPDIQLTSQYNH